MNTDTQVKMLPPEALLANANAVRFGLKKYRIAALAEKITATGGVQTPLKIEPLEEEGPNGEKYVVREGGYRHAAVLLLNKNGAGLKLPCIVEDAAEGVDRIKLQVSENTDRENLSPMDTAVAIKALFDAGVTRAEICGLFARPGGRKGLAMQPLSNSMMNIYMSFLEFPKKIQTMIHDGIIPVSAALELHNKGKDKWDAIIAQCELDRQKEAEGEEKLEEKFLEGVRKEAEAKAKADADAKELERLRLEREKAETESKAKVDEAACAYSQIAKVSGDKEKKEAADKEFRAKDAEAKVAQRKAEDIRKLEAKLLEKAEKNKQLAADRAKKLEEARKQAERKNTIKKDDVNKAAAKVEGGVVKLTGPEMRKAVEMLCLPGSFPKVQQIGKVLIDCWDSKLTDAQMLSALAVITGERKEKAKAEKAK